jgi:hypothetical protein
MQKEGTLMKKLWKKITAALAGTVLSAMAVLAPAVTSLAVSGSSGSKTVSYVVYEKDSDGKWQSTESTSIPITYSSTGSGTPYWCYIYKNFENGKDLLYFHWDNGKDENCSVTLTLPISLPGLTPNPEISDSSVEYVSQSVSGNTVTLNFVPQQNSCNHLYYIVGAVSSDANDWLEPLRTQLRIAADPEFGGNINHTAEYTGDFALPVEIMQYLKAHPDTTLKYSFYVNDVLQTVTISGKDVVIEEGVDWYGFSYLLRKYGNGTAGSGGYTIAAGDTLTSLAKKFGTTVQALAAKNGIKNVDLIYAGSKIAY